jgi:NADPH:quinone reductase-like Zn-dependent oxidoreductase
MKAMILEGASQPLAYTDAPDPQSDAEHVVVRLRAAALNHRDVWISKGQYAGIKYPIILGSDGCGVLGNGAREVIVNPGLNWGNDPRAQRKDFRILGLPDDGTLAEQVKVPSANLADKPAHLTHEQAAALPLAGVTAYRALFTRAQLRKGERVLITGIGGGVALFALQFAVAAGAAVFVTSGSDEKLERARALGALGGANYKEANWPDVLRGQAGEFDVVVDGTAGEALNALCDVAAPGARLAFYGATLGNPKELIWRRVFWKQLSVLGSTMGHPSDFAAMVAMVNEHKIVPVVDSVYALADANAALARMAAAEQFGKIVLKI